MSVSELYEDAVGLLKQLVAIPSFSREEEKTADAIAEFLQARNVSHLRTGNNVYAFNRHHDPARPTILLNSHHDTVRPNRSYTLDPFEPLVRDGMLFGLGSNDAGGSLVSLIAAFLHFHEATAANYNLVLAATAEEEISGHNGVELLLPLLGDIAFGIVGEPTGMHMAVAEKGLLVLDCTVTGKAGHAARDEGDNAIYKTLTDIEWFRTFRFEKVSDLLGPVKMSVTVIGTENKAHNVVPSQCTFVADIRVNELYTFEEILSEIKRNVHAEVLPRSLRMRSTGIPTNNPLVQAGLSLGRKMYGSPTTSDKALMPFPAVKMGPGDSARSHTADEFIYLDEIKAGIALYIELLEKVLQTK